MEQNNPYSTPTAAISDIQNGDGFGDLKIFTANGRIGRIRYLMYTMGVAIIGMLIASIALFVPLIGPFLVIATYVGILVISVFLAIQRSHDFNTTGWMSLVLIVPLVSLIFYFIPGTKGSNNYGLQPPPNSKAIRITAFILLALFILGIFAAIALPAYDDYLTKVSGG